MKKKLLAIGLAVAVLAVTIVGMSIAYFTDTDQETNTFTVGNVQIDLIESQLHRTNASGTGLLGSPEFADQLVPGDEYSAAHGWSGSYYTDELIKADAETYMDEYFAPLATNMVPGRNIHKMPYIVNTGRNAAYVRTRVLIPVELFAIIDKGPSYWTTTAMNVGDVVSEAVAHYNTPAGYAEFMNGTANQYIVEREGTRYYEFDFTYTYELEPGAMTFWNCWGSIRIDPNATSEQLANVTNFNVIIEADAIQAEGFDGYADAFAAFDAPSTNNN